MKKPYVALMISLLLIVLVVIVPSNYQKQQTVHSPTPERTWEIKSIDTMKYSRDLSQEKLSSTSFDSVIDSQMKAIKSLNATHVAICTPYDENFTPILTRWVKAAREQSLKVWFRGNFSGWEGWFGKKRNSISREEHTQMTRDFIKNNPDLFENGDVFSSCPECENGGPGDPRNNKDIEGHRKFLISERNAALEEFQKIEKVITVLDSMNFDVAMLVMDQQTAQAMGGIVAIDHYVSSAEQLAHDIDELASATGAKVFLGEFGAPIPDIHGKFTDETQAVWIENALNLISKKQSVIGINYWVAVGGSTSLFKDNLEPKSASDVVKKYFSLKDFN